VAQIIPDYQVPDCARGSSRRRRVSLGCGRFGRVCALDARTHQRTGYALSQPAKRGHRRRSLAVSSGTACGTTVDGEYPSDPGKCKTGFGLGARDHLSRTREALARIEGKDREDGEACGCSEEKGRGGGFGGVNVWPFLVSSR